MHEKNFYTYAMLNPNRIPYIFLSENNVVVKCLAMLYIYFEKSYMLRFYEVEKRLMFYYIKHKSFLNFIKNLNMYLFKISSMAKHYTTTLFSLRNI